MLAEYERSGMTGAQFARFVGVRYSTLMYWLQKRRQEAGQSEEIRRAMITRVGWKREWRDKPRSLRTSWWKWEVGSACLLVTAGRRRWREKFSGR